MTQTPTTTAPLARLTQGVDPEVARLLPEGVCRTFRVMPYAHVHGVMLVAAAEAGDKITEQVVSEAIDGPVQLVRHTVNEVVAAIDAVYPPDTDVVETPAARKSRTQMAQMLLKSGLVTEDELQIATLEY